MHYGTCCNLLKTSDGRCFGQLICIMEHAVTCSKRLPAGVLGSSYALWNMLWPVQNVCRQMFWTHQSHYGTCCNLLKTSAGRCFGHTNHIMEHDVTCSKRLPAGVLDTPVTLWNMLQHVQNVCRQVFWAHQSNYGTCRNMLKTSAGRCFGHTSHIMEHAATCSKRLSADVLDTPVTLWNMLQHDQNVCRQVFWVHQAHPAHNETCCNMLKTSACRCFEHFLL